MDFLCKAELLEKNPHLGLKGVHRDCGRCILDREFIGLVILTLIIGRLGRGCSNANSCGFLYRTNTSNVAFSQLIVLCRKYQNLLGLIRSIAAVVEGGEFYNLWLPYSRSPLICEIYIKKNKNM